MAPHHPRRPDGQLRAALAGGLVLLTVMAGALGAAASLLGRPDRPVELAPWLALELGVGAWAAWLAGRVCRRMGGERTAVVGLATAVAALGVGEAMVLRAAGVESSLALWAPWVAALGVTLGGGAWPGRWIPRRPRRVARFAPPIAVLGGAAALALWAVPASPRPDVVASALTLDLTIVLPALAAILVARRNRLFVAGGTLLLGCTVAAVTLPAEHQDLLGWFQLGVVPLELGLLAGLMVAARRALRATPAREAQHVDTVDAIRAAARRLLGSRPIAGVVTTELAVLLHALRPPTAAGRQPIPPRTFTLHRRAGHGVVTAAIALAIAVETVPVHLLLAHWSPAVAWVATGLGVYGLLWLLGDFRALAARRVTLSRRRLRVRVGLRWELDIPWTRLAEVSRVSGPPDDRPGTLRAAGAFAEPNVRLSFRRPIIARGMYGWRRKVDAVLLHVDEPDAFVASTEPR